MTTEIILLLIAFQIKHFLCDYPLQTPFMLKKSQSKDWVIPLTLHAAIHSFGSYLIAVSYIVYFILTQGDTMSDKLSLLFQSFVFIGIFDFIIHFTVDRIKAHPDLGGRFANTNPKFWWCLGADQMCHHLTHYFIIYLLVS